MRIYAISNLSLSPNSNINYFSEKYVIFLEVCYQVL